MIEVIYAQPNQCWRTQLDHEPERTVLEIEQLVRKDEPFCWIENYDVVGFAIWGEEVTPDYVPKDNERLELLRPLLMDPMTARRQRVRQKS